MVDKIIASGPVIIDKGMLLVTHDGTDDFYKIPGGKVKDGESLEETCLRELKEETGFDCKIIKKLSTMRLDKKPGTKEKVKIELHHYLCKLKNSLKNYNSFDHNGHKVMWIRCDRLINGEYPIAPNIKYLFDQGDI